MEPLAKRPRGPEVPADDDFRAPELTARLGLLMHQLQRERGLMTLHVADNSWGGRRAARARALRSWDVRSLTLTLSSPISWRWRSGDAWGSRGCGARRRCAWLRRGARSRGAALGRFAGADWGRRGLAAGADAGRGGCPGLTPIVCETVL